MNQDTQKKLKIALIIISLLGIMWLLHSITNFFFIVFAVVLFAVLFTGIAEWFQRKTNIKYSYSLLIVLCSLVLIIVISCIFIAPGLNKQFHSLSQTLPKSFQHLQEQLMKNPATQSLGKEMPQSINSLFQQNKSGIFQNVKGAFSYILNGVAYIFVIVVAGIYLAADPGLYRKGFLKLIPPGSREKIAEVLTKSYKTLKLWLWARGITIFVVAVLVTIGLFVLGIPLAIPLGIIAGLMDFVPNVGPLVAAIPAVLIAFMQGPQDAMFVILLFVFVQSLEGYVLTPLIEKKQVSLPPALILIAQLFFGLVGGIWGLLLASPILAVLIVVTEELYVKQIADSENNPDYNS